jgi:hypothetical protein
MTFIERERTETLAEHLLRNADHLGLSEDQRSRLQAAFRLEQGPFKTRAAKREALADAYRMASIVHDDMSGAASGAVAWAAAAHLAALRADREALLGVRRRTDAQDQAVRGLDRQIKAAASGRAADRVDAATPLGLRRIKARDGLASLFEAKAITEEEAKVGLAYRLLFEECGPGSGLGSQLEERPRAVRASTHGAVAHGLLRAYAGVRLTGVDRAVQHADASGRALAVLRAVAGQGHTVRSLGAGGNTNRSNLEALKLALRIALAALKANGGLRIGER